MPQLFLLPVVLAAACGSGRDEPEPAGIPVWTYDSAMVFPADRSLARPEDGVALADGRLIVSDQVHGLRLVAPDGSSRPFGDLSLAGYSHRPPAHAGGANGVSLEPDGTHVLLADVFGGGIYRVDVAGGPGEKIFQHRYGVNTAIRDSKGAIWFTQSAENTPEEGERRMWESVDAARADGALLRLPFSDGKPASEPLLVLDSLRFANGLAIDEAAGYLYLSETTAGRVVRYRVDLAAGTVTEPAVIADGMMADNLELDGAGRLWIASPTGNEIVVVTTATGERQSVFRLQTPAQADVAREFVRRGGAGQSRMELITPAYWAPLPGMLTGVIVGPTGPVYLSGLGNALLKLPR
jgi:sugar lactone lactonase YvrE